MFRLGRQVVDEFQRIELLRRRFGAGRDGVVVGIGDDAAVLAGPAEHQVVSTDTAVEDVHFRRGWASWPTLGRRALVTAASDLAAMGAEPQVALTSLILPPSFGEVSFQALIDGLADGAEELSMEVVGGNLSEGAQLSITTTVLGRTSTPVLTRGGARPGDDVYVTGPIGSAALGFRLLEAQASDRGEAAAFVERWRRPSARVEEGRALVGRASAAIDISDGLVQDLNHLCVASEVGATLQAGDLPLEPTFATLSAELGVEPLSLAATGGEDYELLFTAPPGRAEGLGVRIGRIEPLPGVRLIAPDGKPVPIARSGHRHFAKG